MNDERLTALLNSYAQTRDRALRDELFESYLPLARSIAAKFAGRGAPREDLEQVAGMGLLKALERYEPERNFRFVTYAVPTITGDLRNYLRDRGGLLRTPRDSRQKLFQMNQARERFEREHLRSPSAKELAEEMEISPEELISLIALQRHTELTSLDTPVDEEGETSLGQLLGEEDDGFERLERRQQVQWLFSQITLRERELLLLRYQERLGQRETARRMGISQMQVSRTERRVLDKLRQLTAQEESL